jgi:ribosomal protein S6
MLAYRRTGEGNESIQRIGGVSRGGVCRRSKHEETVKRYEGLFILNLAGKEDGIKEAVDRVSAEIAAVGGKVDVIQKMEKKAFARVADRRINSGHYVNVFFEVKPSAIKDLHTRFRHSDEVHRALFTEAGVGVPAPVETPVV